MAGSRIEQADTGYLTGVDPISSVDIGVDLNSVYFDCGMGLSGPRADMYQVTFAIVTRVTTHSANETLVETLVDGRARDRATSGSDVTCSGTGRLERAIADLPRHQLRSCVAVVQRHGPARDRGRISPTFHVDERGDAVTSSNCARLPPTVEEWRTRLSIACPATCHDLQIRLNLLP